MVTSYLIRLLVKMSSIHLTYTSWQIHYSYITSPLVIAMITSIFILLLSTIF